MKIKFISVLLVFLLSISITACSNKSSSNIENNSGVSNNKSSDVSISTSSSPTSVNAFSDSKTTQMSSEKKSIMEAYKAVLQNKATFFSTDNKKNVYLNDLLTNKELYGTIFKVTHFAVLDMDGDNIPEIVLELTVGSDVQFYEVLHYMNNEVYGYIQVLRGLQELKADGTFNYSNGALDNGYGKLRFKSDICETDILGYCQPSTYDSTTELYFINNKSVTEELYKIHIKEQEGKKGVVWYDFYSEYIEKELSI